MKKNSLIRLAVVFLLCLLAGVAYVFLYRSVADASDHLASLEKEVKQKSNDAARITAAKNTLRTLDVDEASVASYLVLSSDIVPFLERLELIGTELGADVSVVSVAKEKDGSRERLALSLKITGSFESVMRTIGAIEHAPYDITTSQLSVGLTGTTAGGAWTASGVFWVGTQSAVQTSDKK